MGMVDQAVVDRIKNWISINMDKIVGDLQDFARIPSVSRADLAAPGAPFGPDVARMMAFACARAEAYGFETCNHEGYCASVFWGDRENALGIFGHLDVVPEGEDWIYPPYGATRVGDYLIGRGVNDNKLACAMGLHLLRMFRELELPLFHGLRLVLGGSEETGMQDMAHFVRTQRMPVASIVPDSMFPANYAQKGMLDAALEIDASGDVLTEFSGGVVENMVPPTARAVLRLAAPSVRRALGGAEGIEVAEEAGCAVVSARGLAAHAARPWLGRSAVNLLSSALAKSGLLTGAQLRAMEQIEALTGDFYGAQAGIDCEDPETGKTTMVVGRASMDGGRIRVTVDCRLSIATDQSACRAAFEEYAARCGFDIASFEMKAPFYVPKDDPRIEALQHAYRAMTGRDDPAYTTGGGTYSRMLKNAVTFGPDFPGSAAPDFLPKGHGGVHEPDEAQSIPEIEQAMAVYAVGLIALSRAVGGEGGK